MSLRHAWTRIIGAADYEAHMAAAGQAQANADLVAELFETTPPEQGGSLLVAGAGTGQMFDYLSPDAFLPYRTTFTDLNETFLRCLASRLAPTAGLSFETEVDDLENSSLTGRYDLAIAVLVLEHVDWRLAVASLARLSGGRIFCVIQQNSVLTTARVPTGTMGVLSEFRPQLLDRDELEREFRVRGFALHRVSVREVADAKKMVGLEFTALFTPLPTGSSVP